MTTAISPKIHALIVAAGVGSRFGGETPKQYLKIGDKTILEHSIVAIASSALVNECTLVISKNDTIARSLDFALPVQVVIGGVERWQSVQNGVEKIAQNADLDDLVLIHDAVRPCLAWQDLDRVVKAAYSEPYGAILAVPVADTLKLAKDDNTIHQTIPRQGLWQAQTPQIYRLRHFLTVLDFIKENARLEHTQKLLLPTKTTQTPIEMTDEACAFEALGLPIRLVAGSPSNLKLTLPQDLPLIQAILHYQGR